MSRTESRKTGSRTVLMWVGVFLLAAFVFRVASSHNATEHHLHRPQALGQPAAEPSDPAVIARLQERRSSRQPQQPAAGPNGWVKCAPTALKFPGGCPTFSIWVCGDDGKTYPNGCLACREGGGATSFKAGPCERPTPAGDSSLSKACADPRPESCTRQFHPVCGDDGTRYANSCTACANPLVARYTEGSCPTVECTESQRAAEMCTFDYTPVCGSDARTYANVCMACKSASVSTYVHGECLSAFA